MRFRKSIRIAKGVRINLSKSGMGVSVGGKGFRVGIGPRGAYRTVGIPGTGLSDTRYIETSSGAKNSEKPNAENGLRGLIAILMVLLLAAPKVFVPLLFVGVLLYLISRFVSQSNTPSSSPPTEK